MAAQNDTLSNVSNAGVAVFPRAPTESFSVHSAHLEWAPQDGQFEGLNFRASVENIFDEEYREFLSTDPAKGRTFKFTLSKVGFEMAFFDTTGALLRMSTLDFRDLPQKRTKIRQFVIPETACNSLGRVLVNDVPVCEGLTADTCYDALSLTSRISIKFEN